MDSIPATNRAKGEPESIKEHMLETGGKMMQSFSPVNRICNHLHGFHAYADDLTRISEANHYCAHVNEEVRQCLLYDSAEKGARLIGVEYMVSPRLFETLDPEERKLWHSHVFEVKSGMLVMPVPTGVPEALWRPNETSEMKEVIKLYGKVWNLWHVDRGDELPIGKPELMMSFTSEDQIDFSKTVAPRDRAFGINSADKARARESIPIPTIHPDADYVRKKAAKQ